MKPYFDKGNGWTYLPKNRFITVAKSGQVAWFDEMLDSQTYGEYRGTGGAGTYTQWLENQSISLNYSAS